MLKSTLATLALALTSACATVPAAPVQLTVQSDDTVLPSTSDTAAWARHTPWDNSSSFAQETSSGLQYLPLATGDTSFASPDPRDNIAIYYEGRLAATGEVFDTSFGEDTASILSMDKLIPGWREALQLMHPGDRWLVYVPSEIGYGARGSRKIPAGADLIFEIKFLGITS